MKRLQLPTITNSNRHRRCLATQNPLFRVTVAIMEHVTAMIANKKLRF
jgi:hypothetical protein